MDKTEYLKQYYQNNKEQISAQMKQYRLEHKNEMKQYRLEHYIDNKNKILAQRKQYYIDNKNEILAQRKQYKKQRLQTDPLFRLIDNCRNRVRSALKTNKSKSTLQYIDCSIEFLHQHIQNQFDDKMNWENFGTYWELDHIIPIMYDNPTESIIRRRLHWTNLQPLKKEDNRKKHNNFPSADELIKHNNFSKQHTEILKKQFN